MQKVFYIVFLTVGLAAVLASCSSTKYVPDGEYLLNSVKVKTVGDYDDVNTSNLRNYVRQNPNRRWFSLFKLPLATYSLSGRDSTKWINRTLRSMGEAPVIFDSAKAVTTCADLQQELRNEGYLNARVDMEQVYTSTRQRIRSAIIPRIRRRLMMKRARSSS